MVKYWFSNRFPAKVWAFGLLGLVVSGTGCGTRDGDSDTQGDPVQVGSNDPSKQPAGGAAAPDPLAMNSAGTMAAQPQAGSGQYTGAAGAPGTVEDPGAMAGSGDDGEMMPDPPEGASPWPDLRGGCTDLDSGFPGDDACIPAPAPDEGFQIHVGPTDYTDQAQLAIFKLGGGEETSSCWSYHTPNDEDIYYQGYVFSGRPGTHHIFNSMLNVEVTDGGDLHVCIDAGLGNAPERLGSLPAAGKPYTPRAIVAPENAGVGRFVGAHTPSEADMHYFNVTDADILREFWLNIYYIPRDKVTEEGKEVRGMGGLSWTVVPIAPGTDEVFKYECPIDADGRIMGLAGHFHAHGKRETVTIRRANGERERVFDMYNYNDAQIFPFDSVSSNTPLSDASDGAMSGPLQVFAGDVLEWECHIINDGEVALTYSNDVQDGEMCNVFGLSVGPELNCLVF